MRRGWRATPAAAALVLLAAACAQADPDRTTPSPHSGSEPASPVPPNSSGPSSGSGASLGTSVTGGQLVALGWRSIQAPSSENVRYVAADTAVGGASRPAGPLLRFDLAAGELYGEPGEETSRAEVYARVAESWSDPQENWPDPPGSERWYTFSLLVGRGFVPATDEDMWLDLTQWKGRDGGSPPLAVEVKGSHLRIGGTRGNSGALPEDGDLGALRPGRWTTLTVGIRFSPGNDGWVEVYRDGELVIPRAMVSTMDVEDGAVDPVYLKQGIYRSRLWTTDQTVFFTTVDVTGTRPDVLD